jgi:hypothetical protein
MSTPCTTIEAVVSRLETIESSCLARGDRRSIFATLYGIVTREIRDRTAAGAFHDNAWVRAYAVGFANLYFRAYDGAEEGRAADVPRAWRLCFDAAASGRTIVLQDLLLGVNAHINNDLPFAIASVRIDPDREARHRDHLAVNQVLSGVTERATERLAALYAPGLRTLDAAAGQLDELAGQFAIEVARDSAWEGAVSLTNARDAGERELVATMIGARAAVLARLIRSVSLSPAVIEVCRKVEAGTVFRDLLV